MAIEILLLLVGFPVGFFIAYLCKDELVSGRKWFMDVSLVGLAIGGIMFIIGDKAEAYSSFFIAIIGFVAWKTSFDKKFIGKI